MDRLAPTYLDVRPVQPDRIVHVVAAAVERLSVGESLVVVHDAAPASLRRAVDRRVDARLTWDVLHATPQTRYVRVRRRTA